MNHNFRKYEHQRDFIRIRDMLVETFRVFDKPLNWRIERWNYCRYFVAPMLGAYGLDDPTPEDSEKAIRLRDDAIGIWEDDSGKIVGVVTPDEHVEWHPSHGMAYIQQRIQSISLLEQMVDYAEKTYRNKENNTTRINIYDHDEILQSIARKHGFKPDSEHPQYDSEFIINELPDVNLPEGYQALSMQDEEDIELRRKVVGLSFRHEDPRHWPSIYSYKKLQQAPDYRKDLDLFIKSPEGEYVSCCIVWFDEYNKIGILEPVGSIRLGFGREVVMEGIRRVAALGVQSVWVCSGMRFYRVIGFQRRYVSYNWVKEFDSSD